MEALLEALTLYAEENLIFPLVQAYTPQIRGARIRADRLKEELRVLAPEAEEHLEKLETELGSIHSCREQAFLLAGVSIGLELGRL